MNMTIEIVAEPELPAGLDAAVMRLQQRAFPHEALFARSRHYVHRPRPGDLRVLAMAEGRPVGQVVLYRARARHGGGMLKVACLGNVCSDPDFRGRGAAGRCLDAALEQARRGDCDWALLFCAEVLTGFYGRYGFVAVDHAGLRVTAPGEPPRPYPKCDVMMAAPLGGQEGGRWPAGEVTLDIDVF